tara:strand:+ start:160 stop:480 length:321 start_codon:yes stop_codon:yes gene_type:complete
MINDIQNFGSAFELVINQDTIYSTQILSYEEDYVTINLLNEKWSNFNINQYFNEKYNPGTSVPYKIHLSQIDCIAEVNRPNLLKEYTYIGISALMFWGILTIFDLL